MTETLIITVIKAVNLESKDSNGLSDPYAIVECNRDKFRTRIIYKTLNPVWEESFTLTIEHEEPIKIEIWDDDEADDFEGQCVVKWWMYDELNNTGEVDIDLKLEKGRSVLKRGTVKGRVFIHLKSTSFAEKLAQRGEIQSIFPEIPKGEVILEHVESSFAKTSEDKILSATTIHGTIFLLNHYLYGYAPTNKEPIKFDFAYEMIKNVEKVKKKGWVVIALSGGTRYLIKDLREPDSFIAILTSLIQRSNGAKDDLSINRMIRSLNEETAAQAHEPLTIVLKIYAPDHEYLECDYGMTITTSTDTTFKVLAEQAFRKYGIKRDAPSGYRFFPALPGHRERYYNNLKFDSKKTIAYALRYKLINFGDPLLLRKYGPEEKKKNKGELKKATKMLGRTRAEPVYLPPDGPVIVTVIHRKSLKDKPDMLKYKFAPGTKLKEMVKEVCKVYKTKYSEAHLCRLAFSSDTDDACAYVELDQNKTAEEVYMEDDDLLCIKFDPPFKRFNAKFGNHKEDGTMAYSMLCHCFNNPIHRVWKKGSEDFSIESIAAKLGVGKEAAKKINAAAIDHAKFGVDAVLIELEDRMRNTRFNPFYTEDSFNCKAVYNKWLEEQRQDILNLMEISLTHDYPFCSELHITVVRGANIYRRKSIRNPDPYCTLIYKTQRKSTEHVLNKSNPEWNDLLIFNISTLDSPISLYVYDADIKKDETLGIGSIDLRENSYILDGLEHEIVVEIQDPPRRKKSKKDKKKKKKKDKKSMSMSMSSSYSEGEGMEEGEEEGESPAYNDDYETNDDIEKKKTVTLKVRCYFDASKYYKRVAKYSFEKPEEKTETFAYIKYYSTIFAKLEEMNKIEPERHWLLREFGARFCVSDAYASFLKLQALVGNLEEHFTFNLSRTIVANAKTLVRVTATPSNIEQAGFQTVFKCFITRLMEDYVPGTFIWNAEGDYVKTLEPLLSITEEITTKYPQDNMTYNAIIENAFFNAVCSRLKRANKKFNWSDYQNALTYKDLLEGEYATVCDLIFETIGKAVRSGPTRDAAYAGAIRGVEKYLTEDLGSYIAVLSDYKEDNPIAMQKQQINVLRTIQGAQKLRKSIRTHAGGRHDLKVHQLTGLTILWCKKSQELLHEWVLSVVKNDKHVVAHAKTYSSTAPIDVSEFVSQVIGQLNEFTIDDPFVWTQASELLVSTVLNYIEYESTYACGYFNSTVIAHQKKLEFVCVALSNIEKVQETLNDVIEEIEGFMERWKKTHLSRKVSRLSPASPAKSIVKLTASDVSPDAVGLPEEELNIQLDQSAPAFPDSDDEDEDMMRMEVTTATVNDAISFAIMKSKKWMAAPLALMGKHAADEITGNVIAGIAGKKTADAALSEVSAYYDDELSAISDRVTQRMLKRALEEYLSSLLQRVWDVSRPDYALNHPESEGNGAMDFTKTETCDRCTRIVEALIEYFHAGGEGINKQIIARNKLYKSILQIIDAYKLSTEELITIVKYLTATPPAPLEDKRFEGIDPALVDLIIRNKATTGDKWAIAYSKEGAGSEESTIVRTQLGLPPSEFLILSKFQFKYKFNFIFNFIEWACFNGRSPGSLCLMSKHLGFNFVSKDEEPIVIHLKELKSVSKVSILIFMSGLEVKTRSGDTYTLSKFVNGNVEEIVGEIISQANLVGNTVIGKK